MYTYGEVIMMKKNMRLFIVPLALTLFLTACTINPEKPSPSDTPPSSSPETAQPGPETPQTPAATPAPVEGVDSSNYPRVDGSTATIPLGEALANAAMGLSREECAR